MRLLSEKERDNSRANAKKFTYINYCRVFPTFFFFVKRVFIRYAIERQFTAKKIQTHTHWRNCDFNKIYKTNTSFLIEL